MFSEQLKFQVEAPPVKRSQTGEKHLINESLKCLFPAPFKLLIVSVHYFMFLILFTPKRQKNKKFEGGLQGVKHRTEQLNRGGINMPRR